MKKIAIMVILMITTSSIMLAAGNNPTKITWNEVFNYLAIGVPALYEFLARVIPTVKDYTVLGKLIKILKWLSDKLNNIR